MKRVIDKERRPVYLQLYKLIREDIIAGDYPYNTKLPSKRELAEEVGVSTVTVEHAYALLCEEGYVQARERSGYLVIFRRTDGFARTEEKPAAREVVQTAQAYPDFPLSVLSKTMRRVLTVQGSRLLEKTANSGCVALRQAIRQYLARNRGIHVEVEQIVIGAGSEYLYGLLVELLGRHRTYAIESPSYKQIEQAYRAKEIRCELLPLTSEGIDSAALATTGADVLHTTPYRSYPSGVTATATKRYEYIRWAEQGDRYMIEDDFESEFSVSSKPTETLFALSKKENVVYLNTFSKTASPAMRVGYMVLPKRLVGEFQARLGFYSCTVPTFLQYVLTELIESGDFERHINRVRRRKRKELAEQCTCPCIGERGANQ